MKLIPDSLRCAIVRTAEGSARVLPYVASRIRPEPAWRRPVLMVAFLMGSAYVLISSPEMMLLAVPAWTVQAYRLGPHPTNPTTRTPWTTRIAAKVNRKAKKTTATGG